VSRFTNPDSNITSVMESSIGALISRSAVPTRALTMSSEGVGPGAVILDSCRRDT
jgi:hypothetical protein